MKELLGTVVNGRLIVAVWQEWNGRQWITKYQYACLKCGCFTISQYRHLKLVKGYGCNDCNNLPKRTHGEGSTKLYAVWCAMRNRCKPSQPSARLRKCYVERGIAVSEKWEDFLVFKKWALENGYAVGLQLDRKDNDKGYSPSNCRFVTAKVNSRNTSKTRYITVSGTTRCVMEWSEVTGIKAKTILARLDRGWTPEEAISNEPRRFRQQKISNPMQLHPQDISMPVESGNAIQS